MRRHYARIIGEILNLLSDVRKQFHISALTDGLGRCAVESVPFSDLDNGDSYALDLIASSKTD